ncbi:hypothetical protein [Aestuariimicrobium kwangyangense]|nr:hypothetical protein [Aestuariimicrobium kwangyangense]
MPGWLKKILWALLAAFALYYIFTQPEQTATVVRNFFGGIFTLFRALAS